MAAITATPELVSFLSPLRKAGFACKPGKGSHTKWRHPARKKPVVLSGKDGTDAKPYQEREVEEALRDVTRTN